MRAETTSPPPHSVNRFLDFFIRLLVMPVVLIIMAGVIGTMAYLMITAIFQTISNIK